MSAERADAELVGMVRAGEDEAYRVLVARYQGHVYGLAYSLVGDWAQAQDIAQETFIRAYSNLDQLREPAKFAAWLRRVTFGVAMNWLRAFRPGLFRQLDGQVDLESLEIPDFHPGPAEEAERHELADAVLAAVAALPPKYRVPLTMFHLDGLSYQKVADFLDVPLGTAKSLIHRARGKLKELIPDEVAAEVVPTLAEVFDEHKLPAGFAEEITKRAAYWERLLGREHVLALVEGDPEWQALLRFEMGLGTLSEEAEQIRLTIGCLECCHEHYVENVGDIVGMIGAMKPGGIIDCGQACEPRHQEARRWSEALCAWVEGRDAAKTEAADFVFKTLGERTEAKDGLVRHVIAKLGDECYTVYDPHDEDFDTVESRIQHMDICNYNWADNIRIVLEEIAAGRRLYPWHAPESFNAGWHEPGGFNAHGDCPDRTLELGDMMSSIAGWAEGRRGPDDEWAGILGRPTPEKRWLAASLCKTVAWHHAKYGGEQALAKPLL